MTVQQLIRILDANSDAPIHITLPTGEFVPEHFHVTEVGRVQKNFIDCGGTRRESVACTLQAWAAHDVDHRLIAGMLSNILRLAAPILQSSDLPVEVEYGPDVASQYFVADVEVTPRGLLFVLAGKQTNCLAPTKCGAGATDGCC